METTQAKTFWGSLESAKQSALTQMQEQKVLKRIFSKDPLVWTEDAAQHDEIIHRLGWLEAASFTKTNLEDLKSFQNSIKEGKFRYAVLLGMGGSSLGPEVLQTVFGNEPGFPELIALDSTDPDQIQNVEIKIGHQKTLFIVASKSGTTIESISLYKFFFQKVKAAIAEKAGSRFIAVTDPGMPLIQIGQENNFRKIFLNDPNVGGRYSVLTLFGLVPAAVIGMDLDQVAAQIQSMSDAVVNTDFNSVHPAADLGIGMGVAALAGRDKLTIVTPPEWEIFGDWAEQLIAESTGKAGKGVVPVVRETLADGRVYGNDRFFAGLYRNEDQSIDKRLDEFTSEGHPVTRIIVQSKYDLIGEFYRWEVATAVAGAVMRINPFDQPNVQEAKTLTNNFLKNISSSDSVTPELAAFPDSDVKGRAGNKPAGDIVSAWKDMWHSLKDGDYVSVLAFLPSTPELNEKLRDLAGQIRLMTKKAVTVGLGPRYLHSTGQLHKGGADNGVFLVLTAPAKNNFDLPIPDVVYSFKQLESAQALGDFNALESKGRRVFYLQLKDTSVRSFDSLIQLINDQF